MLQCACALALYCIMMAIFGIGQRNKLSTCILLSMPFITAAFGVVSGNARVIHVLFLRVSFCVVFSVMSYCMDVVVIKASTHSHRLVCLLNGASLIHCNWTDSMSIIIVFFIAARSHTRLSISGRRGKENCWAGVVLHIFDETYFFSD